MANIAVRMVNSLPGALQPHTLYLVKSATSPFLEVYLTNTDATDVRHNITKAEVDSLIASSLAG